MPSISAPAVVLTWVALAAGCGGLADGDYRGRPLAVIQGTLDASAIRADHVSFALRWAPAADHDAALNHFGATVAGPRPAGSHAETCSEVVPQAAPLCDGTAAQGSRHCEWTDDRVASLLRVVDFREHVTGEFEIPLRELPPEVARYDLSGQGGIGSFALASVVVFDDRNGDGAFGLGTSERPPEPTLADSGRQSYVPAPGQPRRSYLVAYLDGLVAPERIDPAFAEVLLFLPQGFSLWVEEEWLDGYGRTTWSDRLWQPIGTPMGLVAPTRAVAGCEQGTRETIYVSAIPDGEAPTWCSEDHLRADWSRTTASPTNGCVAVEERYSGDFGCATTPPPAWDCPRPTSGSLIVSVTTYGYWLDRDGYLVRVDGGAPQAVGLHDSVLLSRVSPGTHAVAIDGLAGTCAVDGAGTAQVTVVAGETAFVAFGVWCGGPGSIQVHVKTSGQSRDPDGYVVSVDGGTPTAIPADTGEAAVFSPLSPGTHVVSLSGLAGNCTVRQGNPLQVNMLPDTTLDVFLQVECALRLVDIRVTTTTSGIDQDPDGYTVTLRGLGGGYSMQQPIAAIGSVLFPGAPLDEASVWISGLAPNCSLASPNPQPVPVVEGSTVDVAFAVECVALGSITVTVTTTGSDLDPDGYRVSWDGGGQRGTATVPANGTAAMAGLLPGRYLLSLGGLAPNCLASGQISASYWVDVLSGQDTAVAFAVECVETGSLTVTTTTTGADPDPDGYTVTWYGWYGQNQIGTVALPATGTVAITGLPPGWYWLQLGGMAVNCDGQREVRVAVVGGAATPVTFDVACAPDRGLAFVSSADGNPEIYFVHVNGTGLQRLTVDPAADHNPAWSPDGARIAFDSNRDGAAEEIYVMDADGSNPVRLTNEPARDYSPVWSPDGTRIAFVSERDGNAEIYVMNADGSNPVRLTNDGAPDHHPDWSPDGARIAFHRPGDYGSRIYVMNADGSGAVPVTPDGGGYWLDSIHPDWSPDGARIAYSLEEETDWWGWVPRSIAVINADGTGEQWLLSDPSGCWTFEDPGWSTDGRHLAVRATDWCTSTGDWIRVIRQDGTDPVDIASGVTPAWRP